MQNFDEDFKDFQSNTISLAALQHNHENLVKLGIDTENEDDTVFGAKYVFCGSHRTSHATGWCSVQLAGKRPLNAQNPEEAFAETLTLGLR